MTDKPSPTDALTLSPHEARERALKALTDADARRNADADRTAAEIEAVGAGDVPRDRLIELAQRGAMEQHWDAIAEASQRYPTAHTDPVESCPHRDCVLIRELVADTRSRPSLEWQKIETAPKDGRPLWLIEDGSAIGLTIPHQFVGFWSVDRRYAAGGAWEEVCRDAITEPTHWMPLPEPPASSPTPPPEAPIDGKANAR